MNGFPPGYPIDQIRHLVNGINGDPPLKAGQLPCLVAIPIKGLGKGKR